jgi:hypothetical protein
MLQYATIYKKIFVISRWRYPVSIAIRISDTLAKKARTHSRALHRSLAGQIEYWAKMGEILEDNPDLSFSFVQEILVGREQAEAGELTPYEFGKGK